MNCPNCGLINPETAQRCDCGYLFDGKAVRTTSSTKSWAPKSKATRWILGGLLFSYGIFQFIQGIGTMRRSAIPPPPSSPVFTPYDDVKRGIRIKVPKDWTIRDDQMIVFSGPGGINVRVGVQATSKSLEDFTKLNVAEIRRVHEYFGDINLTDLGEAKPTVLGGNPAYAVVYTMRIKEVPAKGWQVWTVKNNKAYLLTFTAGDQSYDSYLPIAKSMVASLEIRS